LDKKTSKWIIIWSEALKRNIAFNKQDGSVTTQEILNEDPDKYEPRVTYTMDEMRTIKEVDMNIHLLKEVFRGTIVDLNKKRD
jgi:hypothetical protein